MKLCTTCRHYAPTTSGCWHPINTGASPVDGTLRHDVRWTYALAMRTADTSLDCGPQARLHVPKLESVA